MNKGYRHNHYVPVWYQRRFLLPGQDRYFRLDLKPDVVRSGNARFIRRDVHEWAPDRIFAEDDLYTSRWGRITNTKIERFFFGKVDSEGTRAVDYFTRFKHPSANGPMFENFLTYMSVQKLRTPKGLANLAELSGSAKNVTLQILQQVRTMYCAIWTECVWQIADAAESATKFIISDHPVTVYNRACPPYRSIVLITTIQIFGWPLRRQSSRFRSTRF
jgi:hypothetical protein